jgi:hypothetical protein
MLPEKKIALRRLAVQIVFSLALIGLGAWGVGETRPEIEDCRQFRDQRRYDCFDDIHSEHVLFSFALVSIIFGCELLFVAILGQFCPNCQPHGDSCCLIGLAVFWAFHLACLFVTIYFGYVVRKCHVCETSCVSRDRDWYPHITGLVLVLIPVIPCLRLLCG